MRVHKIVAENFGSFKDLSFTTQDGLTLLHGPTGAGKSTIMDTVSWALYGETSKNGAADDVRSWNDTGVTMCALEIETHSGTIGVVRRRGSSAKQNDLYWVEADDSYTKKRGKDVTETQRLLEERLMVSSSAYHTGSVYNDSSVSGRFFTAKAKERRQLLEQIASIDFPVTLAEKLTNTKKQLVEYITVTEQKITHLNTNVYRLTKVKKQIENDAKEFQDKLTDKIVKVENYYKSFEQHSNDNISKATEDLIKLQASPLPEPCPMCSNKDNLMQTTLLIKQAQKRLQVYKDTVNPYAQQLESLISFKNPFFKQLEELETQIISESDDVRTLDFNVGVSNKEVDEVTLLLELTDKLKSLILTQSISDLETKTNAYLSNHFDSELRVNFALEGSDSLQVTVWKDGHTCSYTQLSKGQKSLLKLCFALSVMDVSNNRIGITIDTVFLDEPFDGIDPELKLKGFSLLQSLNKDRKSIYVIDHEPGFQLLFDNKIKVSLIGNNSHAEAE